MPDTYRLRDIGKRRSEQNRTMGKLTYFRNRIADGPPLRLIEWQPGPD